MKRSIAAIILGIYLFSFSEADQLLKVPVLMQHFVEHQAFEPNTTFWDFIKEHYNGKFEVDEDYERDSQLPFRTSDYVSYSITITETPPQIELVCPDFPLVSKYHITNDESHLFGLVADIWQPPRVS